MKALKQTAGTAALLCSLVCLLFVVRNSHQAVLSKPSQLRRGGEHRQTLVSDPLLLAAFALDIAGLGASMYSHCSC